MIGNPFSEMEVAITNNNMETIKQILIHNENDSIIKKHGWKIATMAAEKGNLYIIEYISAKNPTVLKRKNKKNETIAHIAMQHNHPNIVEYTIRNQYYWPIDKYIYPYSIDSLIFEAAKKGYLNVIQSIDHYPSIYEEPIQELAQLAANEGHLDIASYLAGRVISGVYCSKFKHSI